MRRIAVSVFFFASVSLVLAKDQPIQVSWPDSGQPILAFTFTKFKELGGGMGIGKEHTYVTDVTAKNLSDQKISGTSFLVYVFDKDKSRIGDGYINLTNVLLAKRSSSV